jgi:tetratricopeptide (TPR) repeat protein
MRFLRGLWKVIVWLAPGILVYTIWGGTYGPRIRESIEARVRYPEAKRQYEQGRACYLEFSVDGFREAETHFRAALDRRPGYAKAYAGLGEMYAASVSLAAYRGEDFRALSQKALTESLSAISYEPGLLESHRSLGAALIQVGQVQLGSEEEDRALAIQPNDREARFWKWVAEGDRYDSTYFKKIEDDGSYDFLLGLVSVGWRLAEEGKSEEARKIFEKAKSVARTEKEDLALIHVGMAQTYMNDSGMPNSHNHSGLVAQAISELNQATELDDNLAIAHSNLGNAYFAVGDWPNAETHFEKALRINPNYEIAAWNKAIALYEKGEVQGASRAWQRTEQLSTMGAAPESMVFGKLSQALRLYLDGQSARAVSVYGEAVDAGRRARPAMLLDDPNWCLTHQVLGPRGIEMLRTLITISAVPAH